jgi:hypothetical protein
MIATGSLTLSVELFSLVSAGLGFIVDVILLNVWGISVLFPRVKKVAFGLCGGLICVNGCYGFVTWILLIIKRSRIKDPLGVGNGLGRDGIIAVGLTCWAIVLLAQVLPLIMALTSLDWIHHYPCDTNVQKDLSIRSNPIVRLQRVKSLKLRNSNATRNNPSPTQNKFTLRLFASTYSIMDSLLSSNSSNNAIYSNSEQ